MRIRIEFREGAPHSAKYQQVLGEYFYFGVYLKMKYRLPTQQLLLYFDFSHLMY